MTQSTHTQTAEDTTGAFVEEIGTLVFQSALMHYLQDASDKAALSFETFVEANAGSPSFIDDLCKEYPDFEVVLRNEMSDFAADAASL